MPVITGPAPETARAGDRAGPDAARAIQCPRCVNGLLQPSAFFRRLSGAGVSQTDAERLSQASLGFILRRVLISGPAVRPVPV